MKNEKTEQEEKMILEQNPHRVGDWIIHVFYGLGQIIGIDQKTLEGEERMFLKVKTSDSLYWIPISNTDNDRIRPLATKGQFRHALSIIQQAPEKMAENYLQRRKDISQNLLDVSLYSKVRMIRDLHGRKSITKYDSSDHYVLDNIKDQFLNEWTLVMDEDREVLEIKLNDALELSIEKI